MLHNNIRTRWMSAGILLVVGVCMTRGTYLQHLLYEETYTVVKEEPVQETSLYAGAHAQVLDEMHTVLIEDRIDLTVMQAPDVHPEERVYTFLQGPKSWSESRTWSGEWSQKYIRKNSFGGFGCGLCCMANIYSTLSPYSCSPLDMFDYAREVSGYYPTSKSGAIGWEDMNTTLQKVGVASRLCLKPATYEEFQQQMSEATSAIVLVSSNEDDTFWQDTPGHYVNIWLYDEETDEVFLAEPGSPTNNRSWIPLRYVYDALKTVSQYQYLLTGAYTEETNQWKSDGIDDNWISPE